MNTTLHVVHCIRQRSYWIPGSYAPTLFEKHNLFLRQLKNKGFKKECMTKLGLDVIGEMFHTC